MKKRAFSSFLFLLTRCLLLFPSLLSFGCFFFFFFCFF